MKLVQSIGVSGGFVMSTNLGLFWQLLVLKIAAILSTIGFCCAEWKFKKERIDAQRAHELKNLNDEENKAT